MIPLPSVNLIGVLVATIVGFIIGGVWFAPPVFGNTWLHLLGIPPDVAAKRRGFSTVVAFVSTLLTAYLLGFFVGLAGATTALDGVEVGFLSWFAFSLAMELPVANGERNPVKFVIHFGHRLVLLLVMGAILAAWA